MNRTLIVPLLLVGLSCGCVVVDGSPGGERTTRTSQPGDFDQIVVDGAFHHVDVQVCGDCEPIVKVSGDDRQVEEVIVAVDDGVLELSRSRMAIFTDIKLEVLVRVPSLSRFINEGSSDATIAGVEAPEFTIVNSGSGDLVVEGETAVLSVVASGSGDVSGFDLSAREGDAVLSGSGDVQLCVAQSLRARLTGSGDLFYDCAPAQTDVEATGSGRVSLR